MERRVRVHGSWELGERKNVGIKEEGGRWELANRRWTAVV